MIILSPLVRIIFCDNILVCVYFHDNANNIIMAFWRGPHPYYFILFYIICLTFFCENIRKMPPSSPESIPDHFPYYCISLHFLALHCYYYIYIYIYTYNNSNAMQGNARRCNVQCNGLKYGTQTNSLWVWQLRSTAPCL